MGRSQPLSERLGRDIVDAAAKHDIVLTVGPNVSECADRSGREVWIRPVRGRVSYFVALHEIGHVVGRNPKLRLEQEVVAWRWALEHSIVEPTLGVWRMIHRCLSAYVARAERWKSMKLPEPNHDFWGLLGEARSNLDLY